MKRIRLFWQKIKGHSGLMAVCCVLLLVGGGGLYIAGLAGDWILYGLILLCPLLHFIFMKKIHH